MRMRKLTLKAKPKKIALALMLAGLQLSLTNTVMAGERESLEQLRQTTTNLVELLVQEGVLSREKAKSLLEEARQGANAARARDEAKEQEALSQAAATKSVVNGEIDKSLVRVQYVPQIVKDEMRAEIEKAVLENLNYKVGQRLALPSWIDRLNFYGDLRFRYEHRGFSSNNPDFNNFSVQNSLNDGRGFELNNTTEDRNLLRFRVRFGFDTKVNDWLSGGMRLTTGGLNDTLSGNTTLQTSTSKYEFNLDRMFLRVDPKPWVSIVGGRFTNPFMHTDVLFDPDLPFDGIAATFKHDLKPKVSAFGTLGYFPLDEIESSELALADSKWLLGAQAGVQWQASSTTAVKLGLAYYDFNNVEGIPNPIKPNNAFDGTAPSFRTKGNSYFDLNKGNSDRPLLYGLTSQFELIDLNAAVDIAKFNPVHVTLNADYVKNIGFDKREIIRRTGLTDAEVPGEDTDAFQVRVTVGMPELYKKGNWQAYVGYKYIEADAVLDSYTDSNFYLRGTNSKGFLLGASYGLDERTLVMARFWSAEEIEPRVFDIDGNAQPFSVDVFNIDLMTRF